MDSSDNPLRHGFGMYVDWIARTSATVLVVCYGAGFIILAAHDAHYGIVQFSPLRPRIFFVGFVFCTLAVLSAAAEFYGLSLLPSLKAIVDDTEPARQGARRSVLSGGFVFTAFLMAFLFGLINSTAAPKVQPTWFVILAIALIVILGVAVARVSREFAAHPARTAYIMLGLVLAFFILVYSYVQLETANLTVFLILAAWIVNDVGKRHPDRLKSALDFWNWVWIAFLFAFYVIEVFPNIQSKWGGGATVPVVLYLNERVPWFDSIVAPVSLVDETDNGFYVVLSPKGKAFFIPRAHVSSVYFGSKDDLPKTATPPSSSSGLSRPW